MKNLTKSIVKNTARGILNLQIIVIHLMILALDAEIKLLSRDVMEEVLAEAYREASPDFYALLDGYSSEKNHEDITELVLALYDSSQNAPFPGVWLENALPDLIVAQYDEMALGAMKVAQERKIYVPRQLRFMGFFDTPASSIVLPELTSIEQPTYRLGVASARRLFDIMEDQDYFDVESQEIVLKGRLKIRHSCGNKKTIYEMYE